MSTATGSSTAAAAVPATTQGPAPTAAAPDTAPVPNVPAPSQKRGGKSFAARRTIPDAPAKSGGLSQMLSAVSENPWRDESYHGVTYKVPNLLMFFYVLSLMDNQMVHTKRFTDANADWHPFVSALYFSVLIFYHVLVCQKQGSSISHEQTLMLEFLEENFNIKHAKIPGPLVPFFQSIASCAGPASNYGNVVFGIPNNLVVTQDNDFRYALRINTILPNIIMLLDQIMRIINAYAPVAPAAAGPIAVTMAMADSVWLSIFGEAAGNAAVSRFCMANPVARFDPQVPTHVLSGFIGASNLWRQVLPFDPATNNSSYVRGNNLNNLTFRQILGFDGFGVNANRSFPWFEQVGRIMQPYADFFRDSVSIGAISTTGIGVSYVKVYFNDDTNTINTVTADITTRDVRYQPAGTARYNVRPWSNISVFATHPDQDLDIVAEQMGLLCQVDIDWIRINAAAASVIMGPLRGNIVVGPLENLPRERVVGILNVTRMIPNVVSGYYHTPAASKFE